MPRSCDRRRRAPSASRAALLRALLQWRPNTPVAGQGLAPTPSRPGGRQHTSSADPRRTASSLCADLICDSDSIRDRPTAPRSPWQNSYAERLIGSIRRECLDHVVVFGERHLRHILLSYMNYHNEIRTHLSLEKDAPISRALELAGHILCGPILG